MAAPPFVNDCSGNAPRLAFYLNEDNLFDLRPDTIWPGGPWTHHLHRLRQDGFEGVQLTATRPPLDGPLAHCTLDRINTPEEADAVIARHAGQGHNCLTVHVGWGMEDDNAMDRLVEAILLASERHRLPTYIETHRATITQDMWRTVRLTERFPEVRFNGDFSHYYTGQEMVYGGLQSKLNFLEPVFQRVAFLHARIVNPGHIQAAVGTATRRPATAVGDVDFLADFKAIWTRVMRGFKQNARPGDMLIFCPELLSRQHYYARCFPDANSQPVEESDRYAEALIYLEIARACWAAA
jgi:hypothetical protein